MVIRNTLAGAISWIKFSFGLYASLSLFFLVFELFLSTKGNLKLSDEIKISELGFFLASSKLEGVMSDFNDILGSLNCKINKNYITYWIVYVM